MHGVVHGCCGYACVIVNTLLLLTCASFAVMEFNIQVGCTLAYDGAWSQQQVGSPLHALPCMQLAMSFPTCLQACAPRDPDPRSNHSIYCRCIPNKQTGAACMHQPVMQLPCPPQTDPEAARIVFEAGVPLTMVPLEVTHSALATTSVLQVGAWEGGKVLCMLVCVLWR